MDSRPSDLKMVKRARSWWLQDVLSGQPAESEELQNDLRTDVCIVGGGFTGLWTALHIKEHDPSVDVTIIEKDICGGGASGRNGGFCMTWMSKATGVLPVAGGQEGVRLLRAFEDGVKAVGQFCLDHDIDADFRNDGWLWTATNAEQLDSWRSTVELLDRHGLHPFEELSQQDLAQRSGSKSHLAGVFEAGAATLHPAKLARGLARVAKSRGIRIYEGTAMLELLREVEPGVRTPKGTVRARTVVLALNAWAHELPEFRRSILPVAPDAIITEPVPELLKKLGFENGLAVSDSRLQVDYYRTTVDGRITLGKGGGMIPFAGKVGEHFDTPSPRTDQVRDRLTTLYPELRDVPIAAAWRGPASRTGNGMPAFGRLPKCDRIIYGHGYNGNGVGPSYTGGKILASLALDLNDEWSNTPLVLQRKPQAFLPPEPIRYLGAQLVRAAIERRTRIEDGAGKADWVTRVLADLNPGGLTPAGD